MVEWSQFESGNKILSMNNECGSIAKTAKQRRIGLPVLRTIGFRRLCKPTRSCYRAGRKRAFDSPKLKKSMMMMNSEFLGIPSSSN
jgi:hypothetical protein